MTPRGHRRAYEIRNNDDGSQTIVFTTITDVSGLDPKTDIELEVPTPFSMPNEPGSLRSVESLEEVSDLAHASAAATKRLFRKAD